MGLTRMCDERKLRHAPAAMVLVGVCVVVLASAFLGGCDSRKDDGADVSAGDGPDAGRVEADARAREQFDMGVACLADGAYDDAIDALRQAIAIKPDYAEAYYNMGRAISDYKAFIAIKPGAAESLDSLGGSGPFGDELIAYKKAIALNPDFAEAYEKLGEIYGHLGRYAEEIAAWKKLIALKPDSDRAHFCMSLAYSKLGQYSEAIAACERIIALKPDDVGTYERMGRIYSRAGRYAEAIVACKKAKPRMLQIAEAYSCMGAAYANLGRWSEAIEAYQWVLHIEPDNAHAQFSIGVIYLRSGRYAEGLKAFGTIFSVARVSYKTVRLGADDYQPPSDLPDNEADTREYVCGYVEGWLRYAGRWHCKVFPNGFWTEHGAWVTCRKDGSPFQVGFEEGQCAAGDAAEGKVLDEVLR